VTLLGDRLVEGVGPNELLPGEVFVKETRTEHTFSGHSYERKFVAVGDVSDPIERLRLNNHLQLLDEMVNNNHDWPIPVEGISNPASDIFYENHLDDTTMQFWRDNHMPNAEALYCLQRLDDAGRLFPDGKIDAHARDIFTNAIDSIAIRARGSIHNGLLLKKAAEFGGSELTALALGAGAGVPNIDATVQVRDQYGKRIRWEEYDLSYKSLELNKELFNEAAISEDDVKTYRADYAKAFRLNDESVDIIDMLGLWEYLSRERCVKGVKEFHRILKPGGILVISNMLSDRPQLGVNQKVIGWQGVKPRSIDELVDIAVEAEIDPETITITTSEDNVYAVMEITKL